jgi:hypothetical protein
MSAASWQTLQLLCSQNCFAAIRGILLHRHTFLKTVWFQLLVLIGAPKDPISACNMTATTTQIHCRSWWLHDVMS